MELLRIGSFPMMTADAYDEGGVTKLKGSVGAVLTDFWQCFSSNISFIISSDENGFGTHTENGTYTGVTGLLVRNEADVTFLSNTLFGVPEQLGISPLINYYRGAILSFPILQHYRKQMLKCSDIFEKDVLYFLLASNILLGLTFTVISFLKDLIFAYIQNQFEASRMFVNQANLNKMKHIFSSLLIITLGSSFFFTQIFESGIGADSVSVDYSEIVNSIADIARLKNKRVTLLKNQPITLYLKYHTDTTHKQIYQRGLENVKTPDASLLGSPVTKDDVIVATTVAVTQIAKAYCIRLNRGYWTATEWDVTTPAVLFTAQNISITLKSQLVFEFGLMGYITSAISRIQSELVQTSDSCFRSRLEDLAEDVPTDGITLNRCLSLFAYFFVLLFVSSFIFTLEYFLSHLLFQLSLQELLQPEMFEIRQI